MLKIQRLTNGRVVFMLSGRIEAEDVKELGQLFALETAGQQLVLDLTDLALVNQDGVEFLADCEADSIKLENCLALYPSVDRGGKRSKQAPTNSMKGFEV